MIRNTYVLKVRDQCGLFFGELYDGGLCDERLCVFGMHIERSNLVVCTENRSHYSNEGDNCLHIFVRRMKGMAS